MDADVRNGLDRSLRFFFLLIFLRRRGINRHGGGGGAFAAVLVWMDGWMDVNDPISNNKWMQDEQINQQIERINQCRHRKWLPKMVEKEVGAGVATKLEPRFVRALPGERPSELLQHRICDEHAHALCGQGGKILFQQHDISSMADELLSKDAARLSDDGIKVVKERVLQSAHGFLETTSTYDKYASSQPLLPSMRVQAFKCPELAAELHRPLSCQARQWVSSNIVFVMTFCVLDCSRFYGAFTRDGHCQREPSKYMSRCLLYEVSFIPDVCITMMQCNLLLVCEILEDNAVSAKAGNSECEPWVVTSWLRDHLLSTRERRNTLLWKKVEELLLEDSRIDQYPKVIKGEAKVVLEWQASGSLSGKIKKLQGAAGKTRSGSVGAIKLAEEICGSSISSSRDKELCSSTSKEATNPFM
uniref:Uncharacterized protein n=1 Tax=Aegilops tauschii TaxID=37682 RepID=M8CSV0_AEGTA